MTDQPQTAEPDLATEFAERLMDLVREFRDRGIDWDTLGVIMEDVSENG